MTESSLRDMQTRFAAHIRNPEKNAAPADVEDRRMAIYRRLFFNNIRNFLGSYYPVLKGISGTDGWARLARDFYVEYRAQTPLFPELPREFLRYIQDERAEVAGDPPFIKELTHYEWIRHALSLEEQDLPAKQQPDSDSEADLLEQIFTLSPLAWPLSYRYPVHRISPDFQPQEPPDAMTHLLIYRTRKDMVKFMKLNPVSVLLLSKLQENKTGTSRQLLESIAQEINHPKPTTVIENGTDLLRKWLNKDIILDAAAS
jgi:hypothetical protein